MSAGATARSPTTQQPNRQGWWLRGAALSAPADQGQPQLTVDSVNTDKTCRWKGYKITASGDLRCRGSSSWHRWRSWFFEKLRSTAKKGHVHCSCPYNICSGV